MGARPSVQSSPQQSVMANAHPHVMGAGGVQGNPNMGWTGSPAFSSPAVSGFPQQSYSGGFMSPQPSQAWTGQLVGGMGVGQSGMMGGGFGSGQGIMQPMKPAQASTASSLTKDDLKDFLG